MNQAANTWKGIFKTAAATASFALLHSALASRRAKGAFERFVGPRRRNALHRPLYNLTAVATSAALVAYILKQPSRTLYKVRGPAVGAMRLGQVAAIVALAESVFEVGIARFSGLTNLRAWLKREPQIPREPEGQSPPILPSPHSEQHDRFTPTGVFRYTRHPANFFSVPLLWLNPHMTSRLAAFNMVATAYFYLGSLHSERRIHQTAGKAYEEYRQEVPLFLPRPRMPAPQAITSNPSPQIPSPHLVEK
jgi:steroid 5-alpha reductase family enzyme